jgi:transposase InsO family protein
MTGNRSRTELLAQLRRVGREHGDATVLFHSALAAEAGLHPTDYKALGVLDRLGPMSAGELGRHMGLAAASVTNLIDRLVAKGFLRREPDPLDRRRALLHADVAELAELDLFASWQRTAIQLWERYSDTELAVILDFLADAAQWLRTAAARKAPDALGRDFSPPARPDVRWCGDLTEIPTDEGVLYLASILDLHSRRCVGFALGEHHDAELARAALCVAIAVRGGAVAGVLFHSDQGGEYTGGVFATACLRAGVTQSMGRTGSALDNAAAESFNSTVEFELLRSNNFTTREQARRAVAAWIDEYNTVRRHSTNLMLSPVDYERRQDQARAKDAA